MRFTVTPRLSAIEIMPSQVSSGVTTLPPLRMNAIGVFVSTSVEPLPGSTHCGSMP